MDGNNFTGKDTNCQNGAKSFKYLETLNNSDSINTKLSRILLINDDMVVCGTKKSIDTYGLLDAKEMLMLKNLLFFYEMSWSDKNQFEQIKDLWFDTLMDYVDLFIGNNIPPFHAIKMFESFHDETLLNYGSFAELLTTLNNIRYVLEGTFISNENVQDLITIFKNDYSKTAIVSKLEFIYSLLLLKKPLSLAINLQLKNDLS